MYLAFCSIVIIFNIRLSSVCLMMINVFDRKLTFYFLNTSDGFLHLRPQIHLSNLQRKLDASSLCTTLQLVLYEVHRLEQLY